MLIFLILRNGKKVKTLKSVNMETVFKNFAKYANEKGFKTCIYSQDSFGNTAWQNNKGETLTLVTGN